MNEQKTDIAAAVNATGTHNIMWADLDPEAQRQIEELQFQMHMKHVERSRQRHTDFVKEYMGKDYEPKFADVLSDKDYIVGFVRDPKRKSAVAIPPINMGGKIEDVRPGRMYMCSGYEARMLERVLANKHIETLNLTPSTEGYKMEMVQIARNWGKPQTLEEVQKAAKEPRKEVRKPFGNYVDNNEGPDLATEVVEEERPSISEVVPEIKELLVGMRTAEDKEFMKYIDDHTQKQLDALKISPELMGTDSVNETPEPGTE